MDSASLSEQYSELTDAVAVRRAVAMGNVHKAMVQWASDSPWSAFALARAGLYDVLFLKMSSSAVVASALRGAMEGGHAQLAQRIIDLTTPPTYLEEECAWAAAARGMKLRTNADTHALRLAAAHDFVGVERVLASAAEHEQQDIQRAIKNHAAWYGDCAVMRWVGFRNYSITSLNWALKWALLRGHGRVSILLRNFPTLSSVDEEHIKEVCFGGNRRAAVMLLNGFPVDSEYRTVRKEVAATMLQAACTSLSLRILSWVASLIDPSRVAHILMRAPSSPFSILSPSMSDKRLADAVQCAEFLLICQRRRFSRGRTLPFQALRRAARVRCEPCIAYMLARRLSAFR